MEVIAIWIYPRQSGKDVRKHFQVRVLSDELCDIRPTYRILKYWTRRRCRPIPAGAFWYWCRVRFGRCDRLGGGLAHLSLVPKLVPDLVVLLALLAVGVEANDVDDSLRMGCLVLLANS